MLAQIKIKFEGSWIVDRSEKFDEFLQAIGINEDDRKRANSAKSTCKIGVEGEEIHIESGSSMGARSETFKLNQEYDSAYRGGKAKVISTFQDGKLVTQASSVETQTPIPTIYRDVIGSEMYFELHVGDIVCKRYYKRA